MKARDGEQQQILELLSTAWREDPGVGLLELIGSCFAGGDLCHINDTELQVNLEACIEVNRESNRGKKRLRELKKENK